MDGNISVDLLGLISIEAYSQRGGKLKQSADQLLQQAAVDLENAAHFDGDLSLEDIKAALQSQLEYAVDRDGRKLAKSRFVLAAGTSIFPKQHLYQDTLSLELWQKNTLHFLKKTFSSSLRGAWTLDETMYFYIFPEAKEQCYDLSEVHPGLRAQGMIDKADEAYRKKQRIAYRDAMKTFAQSYYDDVLAEYMPSESKKETSHVVYAQKSTSSQLNDMKRSIVHLKKELLHLEEEKNQLNVHEKQYQIALRSFEHLEQQHAQMIERVEEEEMQIDAIMSQGTLQKLRQFLFGLPQAVEDRHARVLILRQEQKRLEDALSRAHRDLSCLIERHEGVEQWRSSQSAPLLQSELSEKYLYPRLLIQYREKLKRETKDLERRVIQMERALSNIVVQQKKQHLKVI